MVVVKMMSITWLTGGPSICRLLTQETKVISSNLVEIFPITHVNSVEILRLKALKLRLRGLVIGPISYIVPTAQCVDAVSLFANFRNVRILLTNI